MLTIATYNVWFDTRTINDRIKKIYDLLVSESPTVMCLQEVTAFIYAVLVPKLEKQGYVSCYTSVDHFKKVTEKVGYGVLIMSKIPFASVNIVPFMKTSMGRYYVIAKLASLYIVNTHLESLGNNKETRKSQLNQILEFMKMVPNTVLCMDSNLTDTGDDKFPDTDKLNIADAFIVDGSIEEKRYTYDCNNNENIIYKFRSRLDRIYHRGVTQLSFSMFGMTDPPSDHYGLKMGIESVEKLNA